MVILGGLEIVAAGYLLKELHNDSKEEEERERERRRRRRHHSREDHHRPHRHDDSPPGRPSRPSQQLMPPQQGPPRPYSAPPPQNRPQMLPVAMAATAAAMWPRPQQGPAPQPGPPQSYPTWPQGPPQQQGMQQRPSQPQPQPQAQGQWQGGRPPQTGPSGNNFIPPPLPRPQTNPMYPPPGVHIDLKTGKIQHDMLPPEMPRDLQSKGGEAREYYEGGRQESFERRRENSMPTSPPQRPQFPPQPYGPEHNSHSYSQPQISVTPAIHHPQGYAELDSETPGRYRSYGDEKSGRGKSNSFSGRPGDDDFDMRSPPPAYREY